MNDTRSYSQVLLYLNFIEDQSNQSVINLELSSFFEKPFSKSLSKGNKIDLENKREVFKKIRLNCDDLKDFRQRNTVKISLANYSSKILQNSEPNVKTASEKRWLKEIK